MNEFVAHVMKKLEANDDSINKLIRKTKKNGLWIGILIGFGVYQAAKISDLQFEISQLKKKVDEQEPIIVNNYQDL